MPKLKSFNLGGCEYLVNKDLSYAPYWQNLMRRRVRQKRSTICVVTGPPGEGKSYMAMDICRVFEGFTKTGIDRFKLKQVVFTYKGYLDLITDLELGRAIVLDEPSYSLSHREWYQTLNRALVLTLESQRFKVHPLFLPIVNKELLDKTIRSYLIQYQIVMRKRGLADVYEISPSQRDAKIYHTFLCRLDYDMLDLNLCDRDSCLDCEKLNDGCNIFRARYERKKAKIQDKRYEQAKELATTTATSELTDQQKENMLYSVREKFSEVAGEKSQARKIDREIMRIVARDDFGIHIPRNKAVMIAKSLGYHHPNEFV